MQRFLVVAAAMCVAMLVASPAAAQDESVRYAEEPTLGLDLPLTALAGEYDAMATVANPAGLVLLRGTHYGLLLHVDDPEHATGAGPGAGGYAAIGLRGGLLPPLGFGVAVEVLRPDRTVVAPDPGEPTRLSLGTAYALGRSASMGVAYHRFFDDPSQALHGVDTWDLGFAARLGPRVAVGLAARDLARPLVAGNPVQRRWEAELALRPTATERLDVALGGRFGETRRDVDGWLRLSWRVARGVYLKAEVAAVTLQALRSTPGATRETTDVEGRVSGGLELSFGRTGVTALGAFAGDTDGDSADLQSGSVYLRVSEEEASPLQGDRDRIAQFDLSGPMNERRLTGQVILLKDAREDDAVTAVFVKVDGVGGGWAAARTLRAELAKLRAAGKPVLAYLIAGTTKDYYIASVADRVWVDPGGGVRLDGFAATSLHYKGLLDDLGVEAQFEKIEEYKSAPESFTRTEPSEPALRMRNELYDDLYATIVDDIASGRHKSADEIRALIDGGPYTAGQLAALPALVDGVVAPDDLGKAVREALGARAAPFLPRPNRRATRWDHPAMAVIYIEGDIVTGRSQTIPLLGRRLAGADTIVAAIAAARADAGIDAIVLRIDSPGGHALASEVIAREVFKTRGVKPIICSLGDLAASGGYFVAAGCDRIFAEPTTITGSIGIFVGKVDLSALLSRLGVSWTTFKRGAAADRESYFRPYSEDEKQRVKEQIRYYYDRFVEYVGKGRGMTAQEVDDVGRGRVWTGRQASGLKLVDELGGIGDAIAYAKDKAGIDKDTPTRVVQLPEAEASLLGKLLGVGLSEHDDASLALAPGIRDLARALPGSLWVDPGQPQALLPFAVVWE